MAQRRRDPDSQPVTPTPSITTVTPTQTPSVSVSPSPTGLPDEDDDQMITPTPRPQRPSVTPTPTPLPENEPEMRSHDRQEREKKQEVDEQDNHVLPASTTRDDQKPTPPPENPTPDTANAGVSERVSRVYRSVVEEPLSLLERSLPREFYLHEKLSPRGNAVLLSIAALSFLLGYFVLRGPLVKLQGLRSRFVKGSYFERRTQTPSTWMVDGPNRM